MKSFFRHIFLAALLSVSYTVIAQTPRQVLDKAVHLITSKGGATAQFTVKANSLNARGTIYLKANKFYASTPQAAVWFNGKTQWTYMKGTNEVNISTPNEAKQAQMNPYKFMTLYKSGYQLSMKKVQGKYIVHLLAQNKKRSIQELYITINRNTNKLTEVKMRQGAAWTTLSIHKIVANKLADSIFTFPSKDYPKAEIIDLR